MEVLRLNAVAMNCHSPRVDVKAQLQSSEVAAKKREEDIMPKVFVSVAYLCAVVVLIILFGGVWGNDAGHRALRQQQRILKARQDALDRHANLLQRIENLEYMAEANPSDAKRRQEWANRLRQEIGVPLKDYGSRPHPPVATAEAELPCAPRAANHRSD
jgi:hypothetical protein